MTPRTARPRPGVVAAWFVVLSGAAPLLLLEWLQAEGTLGGLRRAWLWGAVAGALVICGLIAAWAARRIDETAPGTRADTWAVLAAGGAVWLVLSLAAPLLVLLRNAGDEIVGVAGAGLMLYLQWGLAVLLAAGAAVVAAAGAHHYLRRDRQRTA